MLSLRVRNVNEALPLLLNIYFGEHSERGMLYDISPRGSRTLELHDVFSTTYKHPWERVLFSPTRDCNHYFHFFESMWILAGRDDVKFLTSILGRIADYSDNGTTFHGAYGPRIDAYGQLHHAVKELERDKNTRRAVISIWQPELDAGYSGKDMPCNVMVTFKIREDKLRMTVFNRSNDMIWGAYGANAVQFSFLQEYVASWIGIPMGQYTQISDSFHVYPDNNPAPALLRSSHPFSDPYEIGTTGSHIGLLEGYANIRDWTEDLFQFFLNFDDGIKGSHIYKTVWWNFVAQPLWLSLLAYKSNDLPAAKDHARQCIATDWSIAVQEWLARREASRAGA